MPLLVRTVWSFLLALSGMWTLATMAQDTRLDRVERQIERAAERAVDSAVALERRLASIETHQVRLQTLIENIESRMNAAGAVMLLLAGQAIAAVIRAISDWRKQKEHP